MKAKLFLPIQIVFMLCTLVSGLDYTFGIGRWKSYVQLFGWTELLLTAAAAVLLVLHLMMKDRAGTASGLLCVTFLLWLMQFCPAIYALMLNGAVSSLYPLFHLVCILLGGGWLLLFRGRAEVPSWIKPDWDNQEKYSSF